MESGINVDFRIISDFSIYLSSLEEKKLIILFSLIFFTTFLFKNIILVSIIYFENFISYKMKTYLRIKLASKYFFAPYEFHINENSSSIISNLVHEVKISAEYFKTIIIDSDGQDNPKIISKILSLNKKNPKCSIAINRGQRREPIWFKLFYEAYCILVKLFCFKKIRFGNYSLVDISDLKKITEKKELWSAFPPTLSKNSNRLLHLSADREKRYGGDSKMNFYGLVYHALRVFSALKLNVLFSKYDCLENIGDFHTHDEILILLVLTIDLLNPKI